MRYLVWSLVEKYSEFVHAGILEKQTGQFVVQIDMHVASGTWLRHVATQPSVEFALVGVMLRNWEGEPSEQLVHFAMDFAIDFVVSELRVFPEMRCEDDGDIVALITETTFGPEQATIKLESMRAWRKMNPEPLCRMVRNIKEGPPLTVGWLDVDECALQETFERWLWKRMLGEPPARSQTSLLTLAAAAYRESLVDALPHFPESPAMRELERERYRRICATPYSATTRERLDLLEAVLRERLDPLQAARQIRMAEIDADDLLICRKIRDYIWPAGQ